MAVSDGSATVPIAVFVRVPEPGIAKTRLASVLGDAGAAEMYRAFVEDTLRTCASVNGATVQIWRADSPEQARNPWLDDFGFDVHHQSEGDLGVRIFAALDHGIAAHGRALVLGSDSPTLPAALIANALSALDDADLVLGPTHDGGYYLIGARGEAPPLNQVRWSTVHTLGDTLFRNRARSIRVLSPWYDIDTPDDLELLRTHLSLDAGLAPSTRALLR